MKRLLALFALLGCLAARSARAQDLGVVAPRTYVEKAFNNINCSVGVATHVVADRNLNSHMVVYYTTGTINSIELGIDGSFDGVNYVDIVPAHSFSHPIGSDFAKIYMPFIRIHLYACSGSGTITAWYSGTWALDPWSSQPIPPSPAPSTFCDLSQVCEWDDFISGGIGSGSIGKMGWSLTSTNTLADSSYQTGYGYDNYIAVENNTYRAVPGHPGILGVSPGGGAGGCVLDAQSGFGGLGYMVGDILTLLTTSGFGDGTATVQVLTVNGSGSITGPVTVLDCGTNYNGWFEGGGSDYNTSGGSGDGNAIIEVDHTTYARAQSAVYVPSDQNATVFPVGFDELVPDGTWTRTSLMLPGFEEGEVFQGTGAFAVGLLQYSGPTFFPVIPSNQGAYFYVDTTFSDAVTGISAPADDPGTGYVPGDVVTIDPAFFSDPLVDPYGIGATARVDTVDGGGGIASATLLTGGRSGYFATASTGAPVLGGSGTDGHLIVTDAISDWWFWNNVGINSDDLDTGVNSELYGLNATGAEWTEFTISHTSGDTTLALTISNGHDRSNIVPLVNFTSAFLPTPGFNGPYPPLTDFFQTAEFCPVGGPAIGATSMAVDAWQAAMSNLTEP